MRQNTIKLMNNPFNVKEICTNVCKIIEPQTAAEGKQVIFQIVESN